MKPSQIKILIADDHPVFRTGLKAMLEEDELLTVIGEAADGKQLLDLIKTNEPDVILVDIEMPVLNGELAVREILASNDSAACIMLSMYNNPAVILNTISAGAKGYVTKTAKKGEIIEAVKEVFNGRTYFCSDSVRQLSPQIAEHIRKSPSISFTERELKIIHLICTEKTSVEIAAELHLGKRTIENIRFQIMERIQVSSVVGLVRYAIRNNLFKEHSDK